MSITEAERHQLYQRLEAVLGPEEATTLMEHLPPVGWADVATKRDVDHLEHVLRADMSNLEVRLSAMESELRHEMATKESVTELRGEMATKESVTELRRELRDGLRDQRHVMFALFGANTAVVAVAMAILRLA
jgi:hypothetical protein